MKSQRIWQYILAILPLVIVLFMLPQIGDSIPAHYGFDGMVDRWGSKYELLILPILSLLLGVFSDLILWAKRDPQKKKKNENEKVNENETQTTWVRTTILILLSLFLALTIVSIYLAKNQIEQVINLNFAALPNVYTIIGAFLIVVGAIMPFVPRNQYIGARTSWALQNDQNWKKAQKFGGISVLIGGAAIVAISIFFEPGLTTTLSLIVAVTLGVVNILYSWSQAKEADLAKEQSSERVEAAALADDEAEAETEAEAEEEAGVKQATEAENDDANEGDPSHE